MHVVGGGGGPQAEAGFFSAAPRPRPQHDFVNLTLMSAPAEANEHLLTLRQECDQITQCTILKTSLLESNI